MQFSGCQVHFKIEKVTQNVADLRKANQREERVLKESRAVAPFGFHVVLPDMRGRVRGKRSTSINSSYIRSLC